MANRRATYRFIHYLKSLRTGISRSDIMLPAFLFLILNCKRNHCESTTTRKAGGLDLRP